MNESIVDVTCEMVRLLATESAGGADRDRTDDPRLAKPVLSQLSYSPFRNTAVGLARLELATLPLSGVRSNHLSYRPWKTCLGGGRP
jgi:hypothetical protein